MNDRQVRKLIADRLAVSFVEAKNSGGGSKCTKGKSCSKTCISRGKECLMELEGSIGGGLGKMVAKIAAERSASGSDTLEEIQTGLNSLKPAQRRAFEEFSAMMNSGKVTDGEMEQVANLLVSVYSVPGQDRKAVRSMSWDETADSMKRLDSVEKAYNNSTAGGKFDPRAKDGVGDWIDKNARTVEISKEVGDLAYRMIPAGARNSIDGAGRPGQHWTGLDSKGDPIHTSKSSQVRGEMLVRRYMEQGGRDPYTGRKLDIRNAEPEHIVAVASALKLNGKGDDERNLVWSSVNFNNIKRDRDIGDLKEYLNKTVVSKGKESYEAEYAKRLEGATGSKERKATTPTAVAKALESQTPQQRVSEMKALAETYRRSGETKYLLDAFGISRGAALGGVGTVPDEKGKVKSRGGGYIGFDQKVRVFLGKEGKKVTPSTASIVALALVPPEKRKSLVADLDKAIDKRKVTNEEAGKFKDPKDPAYQKLIAQKSEKFGKEVEGILTSYVPNIGDYL